MVRKWKKKKIEGFRGYKEKRSENKIKWNWVNIGEKIGG